MFRVVFLATIVVCVTTIRTTTGAAANNNNTGNGAAANESECREELEQELGEYVKLDSWQKLFTRHLKFIVNGNGEIVSERRRLKFNTIIHNAIFGCDHERDDEVDDCPNIYPGSIKSCEHGKNLRAAMFRSARCALVESSVKHLVLSNVLLDAYPSDMLEKIPIYADQPIREFGETVVSMLKTLAHGETGGLGELMALNLYLNNKFGTVFMYKIPVEPVRSMMDFRVAGERMRHVHGMILEKLYTFWDTWCGDKDIVTQYRLKYENRAYVVALDDMHKNMNEANALIRSLNVSGPSVHIDFDPKRIALADFVDAMITRESLPDGVSADLRLKSFEVSYEFNPQIVHEYQRHVFRTVYACFYSVTITHLKLAVRMMDVMEKHGLTADYHYSTRFVIAFVKFIRPLTVFDMNRFQFVTIMSPKASANMADLLAFLLRTHYASRNQTLDRVIASCKPRVHEFVNLFSDDAETMLNVKVPDDNRFDNVSYETAWKLIQSNYQSFARLVSATNGFKDDRTNAIKLKRFMSFLSEAVDSTTPVL